MLTLPVTPTDADILTAIHQWWGAIVDGRYPDAWAMTLHDPADPLTLNDMREMIVNYGSLDPLPDGKTSTPSPVDSAVLRPTDINGFRPSPPVFVVYRDLDERLISEKPSVIAFVCFDLPLDGVWSQVTALFHILGRDDHAVLEFLEARVL